MLLVRLVAGILKLKKRVVDLDKANRIAYLEVAQRARDQAGASYGVLALGLNCYLSNERVHARVLSARGVTEKPKDALLAPPYSARQ